MSDNGNGTKSFQEGVPWIAFIVTICIFGLFAMAFYATATGWIKNDNSVAQQMSGALIAAFASAVGYWLGSSRGSTQKDALIADITSASQKNASIQGSAAILQPRSPPSPPDSTSIVLPGSSAEVKVQTPDPNPTPVPSEVQETARNSPGKMFS